MVDLIGMLIAKTLHFNNGFYASTRIYTTVNLVDLVFIDTKSSDAIAEKINQT